MKITKKTILIADGDYDVPSGATKHVIGIQEGSGAICDIQGIIETIDPGTNIIAAKSEVKSVTEDNLVTILDPIEKIRVSNSVGTGYLIVSSLFGTYTE